MPLQGAHRAVCEAGEAARSTTAAAKQGLESLSLQLANLRWGSPLPPAPFQGFRGFAACHTPFTYMCLQRRTQNEILYGDVLLATLVLATGMRVLPQLQQLDNAPALASHIAHIVRSCRYQQRHHESDIAACLDTRSAYSEADISLLPEAQFRTEVSRPQNPRSSIPAAGTVPCRRWPAPLPCAPVQRSAILLQPVSFCPSYQQPAKPKHAPSALFALCEWAMGSGAAWHATPHPKGVKFVCIPPDRNSVHLFHFHKSGALNAHRRASSGLRGCWPATSTR